MFERIIEDGAPLIARAPRCPFPMARDRAAWEALPEAQRAALRRLAAAYRDVEYPLLTARRFMAFGRAGDRLAWEKPYFLRRRKLCAALLSLCVDGDFSALDDVIDGIWLICEESSWVISAHNGSDHEGQRPVSRRLLPEVDNPYIDLFSAQTAMILSLACALLEDALDGVSPLIRRRVRREIEARVLRPFETRDDFWWMGVTRRDLCNWTPWIVSNVMLTACAWIGDSIRLSELLARGMGMLDRYIRIIPPDGDCDEGPGYWSMAGGALLDCLELIEAATGLTFWDDEKLKNILRFPLSAWLGDEWFMNFADCDAKPDIPGERLQFAGEKLNDPALMAFGVRFRGDPACMLDDTPQLWRLLNALFHPANGSANAAPPGDVWLKDMQVRIVRSGGMALACKAGVNAGSHSHNDCGSFMLYRNGAPVIVDAGNMTYTGKTFSSQRYTLWNTRAMYHNIPLIGGVEQQYGWNSRAKDVRATDRGIVMDLSDAYPLEGLRFTRALALDGALTLDDVIRAPSPMAVTEVLLLRQPPRIEGKDVLCGGVRISPEYPMNIAIGEIPVTDPRMARNFPGSLWRVTFEAAPAAEHRLRLVIAPEAAN